MPNNSQLPISPEKSWAESARSFCQPKVATMLFLGFSAGLPILLIFSSLSIWLREADVSRSAVTYFSWAALGYSFKFVWAPLVDQLNIPVLGKRLGRRRSWMLLSQISIIAAILWMSSVNPASSGGALTTMALAAVLLGFSSATQDIVIDAFRIESAKADLQALLSSTYIAGYRIGMLVAGAGALYLAELFGSSSQTYSYTAWQSAYMAMAGFMLVGVICTLLIREPKTTSSNDSELPTIELVRFMALFVCIVIAFILSYIASSGIAAQLKSSLVGLLNNSNLSGFIVSVLQLGIALISALLVSVVLTKLKLVTPQTINRTYIAPVQDFFKRYGVHSACLLLALISVYRMSDIVLGVISNVFYTDLGYQKSQIASIVKSFGLAMTLVGGFLGGLLSIRFGVMRILLLGAILGATSNLLFMLLASYQEHANQLSLIGVIAIDNLSAGLASAAFVAFLSALTNIKFTAVQFAIFTSLMTLLPKILGGYSGSMVDAIGYAQFFFVSALLGIPAILLIVVMRRKFELQLP